MKKGFRIIKFKKNKPIFELKDISKSFDGRPILKKISISHYMRKKLLNISLKKRNIFTTIFILMKVVDFFKHK